MRYFILTWQPDKWEWENYLTCIESTKNNTPVDERWSFGNRKDANEGDRVFLYRQKDHRGIIGSGIITSDGVYIDTHFSDPSKKGNCVDCRFENLVLPTDVLCVDDLKEIETSVPWDRLQASGVEIPADQGHLVENRWQAHLRNLGLVNDESQIDFSQLIKGHKYDRNQLAALWGYEDFHAIGRGIVTPKNEKTIILFVTEKHQPTSTQYDNRFDGESLWMDGEEKHKNDIRLMNSLHEDDVHLFYRSENKTPFTYHGQVFLVESETRTTSPSRFLFSVSSKTLDQVDLIIEDYNPENYEGEKEGLKKLRLHVIYERKKSNRDAAIQIHGTTCKACKFNFNMTYGEELAKSYIEIHHTTSITELNGKQIDPNVDLVPLCANCHRMAHRAKGKILTVEEIQELIEKHKANSGI